MARFKDMYWSLYWWPWSWSKQAELIVVQFVEEAHGPEVKEVKEDAALVGQG
jgi:hypothetical protein